MTGAGIAFERGPKEATPFTNGANLKPGYTYRCISNGEGEVLDDEGYLLVTDQLDKRGNRLLVNTSNGSTVYASPKSIWLIIG